MSCPREGVLGGAIFMWGAGQNPFEALCAAVDVCATDESSEWMICGRPMIIVRLIECVIIRGVRFRSANFLKI